MHEGADLRKYRQAIDLSQKQFAQELGIAQATLSLIESGKNSLTSAVKDKLEQTFRRPQYARSFSEFISHIQLERGGGSGLVGHTELTHVSLPVWQWDPAFDLSNPPAAVTVAGIVTLRRHTNAAVAIAMPEGGQQWTPGEVLAFAPVELGACKPNDLCLIQRRAKKAERLSTMIAISHVDTSGRHRSVRFEVLAPNDGEMIDNPDTLTTVLRCVYRGRYVD